MGCAPISCPKAWRLSLFLRERGICQLQSNKLDQSHDFEWLKFSGGNATDSICLAKILNRREKETNDHNGKEEALTAPTIAVKITFLESLMHERMVHKRIQGHDL